MTETDFELALRRMPHRGQMLLIDRVLSTEEDAIRCLGRAYPQGEHPLAVEGRLYPVSLVELGAQAAAAHASLHGLGGGHVGLLIALQNVAVTSANLDETSEAFEVEAKRVDKNPAAARYSFCVRVGATDIVTGEALMSISAAEEGQGR